MKNKSQTYRDQEWLENLLAELWYHYFSDIDQTNQVLITFGRKAKRRLGSIGLSPKDHHTSIITINRIFEDLEVPEYVISATIIHELTHYAHGFNSPLERRQTHPHSGGVIRQEFAERGLENLYQQQRKWLKDNWPTIVNKYFPNQIRYKRGQSTNLPIPWWLRGE